MGRNRFSRLQYDDSVKTYASRGGRATSAAEEKVGLTGKLDPLVDPAEYGVIRRSLVRFEERPDGLLELTVGCSMPIEVRLDTTGSMQDNVDRALKVLPDTYEQSGRVLHGFDVHVAIGIFGDCMDRFVLCRPQFEMEAPKIVQQLTLMFPEGGGYGNGGEDPQYGLFGGAYLVAAYANCIGLKRYDFTISDEPAREYLSEAQLVRVFGSEVFDKVAANGWSIDRNNLPSTKEVVQDLLTQAHAFFLEVPGYWGDTHGFWTSIMGPERVVVLPDIDLLPQTQAIIIGLTEGTLALDQVGDFLAEYRVSKELAKQIERSVANIPIGAQVPLRDAIRVPQAGDLFRVKPDVFAKTDLWPIDPSEVSGLEPVAAATEPAKGPTWL